MYESASAGLITS
ncbi:uncharacterized protein FRV6_15464 [Fusarium oxysporum]|uniref:Uncharacterized protein n=1 Tax=Fusarium oxysporum TaxID=5507 RepID=A0A2H3U7H6_FUSOX|nr:uncharacterized protein FRV6_15464 [Fusarium oxysporum]